MAVDQAEENPLDPRSKVDYSDNRISIALASLRVAMGWILLQGGLPKALNPNWNTAVFYERLHENNPFMWLWNMLEGSTLIDTMNAWGLTLTGIGLITGVLVRWNAFWGTLMMTFYWASSLKGGLTEFLPLGHAWVVDSHMVYIIVMICLMVFGAGRAWGVDAYLEKTQFAKQRPWTRYILG